MILMQRLGVQVARVTLFFSFLLLAGCNVSTQLAPVIELNWKSKTSGYMSQKTHKVRRGDTLYSIAFRYDKDYRLLADYNRLRTPYDLQVGQVIYLQYLQKVPNQYYAPVRSLSVSPKPQTMPAKINRLVYKSLPVKHFSKIKAPTPAPILTPIPILKTASTTGFRNGNTWRTPAQGTIVRSFLPLQGKKGIDIAGQKGEPIHAAKAGTVAYAGNGIAGYGNLIIIKHEGQFLTAYGNNLKNYVHEGQKVKVGQIIAEMGRLDGKYWGVHFEIRKAGQPVNPIRYLN